MGASGNRRSIKLSNLTSSPVEEKMNETAIPSFADNLEEAINEEPVVTETVVETEAEPVEEVETPANESEEMAAEFAAAFNGALGDAATPANDVTETETEAKEETAPEEVSQEEKVLDEIVEKTESVADALVELENRKIQQEREEDKIISSLVSNEVGYIAKGTKVHGDIIADGHLEIQGVVEGGINARGNVKVNGDVFGDIACGNLIINEGVLKVDVQAREDISLGAAARIEGDIKCRRISIEGTVVGNIVATELIQVAETATVTGNLTTGGIAIGMGATINGNIKMVK